MFSTLITILRGEQGRARDRMETVHAAVIVEQKIREAGEGHEQAKRTLASLILRERTDARALTALEARIADMEARMRKALESGKDALARDGAQAIADMENECEARSKALERTRLAVQRLRVMIERSERRLTDLRQGLITARAMEAERRTTQDLRGRIGGDAALSEAEGVLKRALDTADSCEEFDILDGINAELSGDDLIDRMAAEGFGSARRTSASDVLARFAADAAPARPEATSA